MILTTGQYGKIKGWSRQAVRNNIIRGNLLPGVYKTERKGSNYLLYTRLNQPLIKTS